MRAIFQKFTTCDLCWCAMCEEIRIWTHAKRSVWTTEEKKALNEWEQGTNGKVHTRTTSHHHWRSIIIVQSDRSDSNRRCWWWWTIPSKFQSESADWNEIFASISHFFILYSSFPAFGAFCFTFNQTFKSFATSQHTLPLLTTIDSLWSGLSHDDGKIVLKIVEEWKKKSQQWQSWVQFAEFKSFFFLDTREF